jgi:4-diphosphocytidyl-2-C-methyl-D-erythritol kinase
VDAIEIFAPAKLNLFLAITGRRADGFHDLVSVVAPLAWGDSLHAERAGGTTLACDDAAVPVDGTNLVLKAAAAFARRTGWRGGVRFRLTKRVPMGAGLGGGSSDGVAALKALRVLAAGEVAIDDATMAGLAAELGSDCALFLRDGPVTMRGRGEKVEPLPERAGARIRGRRVLVFKPEFGIATPWAYAQLAAAAPGSYLPAADAEARLAGWTDSTAAVEELLCNNMEAPAFRKFVALPVLLELLRREHGLAPRMSGSGSACFAPLADGADSAPVARTIRDAWGDSAFVVETRMR